MAGRPKKTETKINEEIVEKQQENNSTNDMFSSENMAKMFAMFKQFQTMEEQQNIKKQETIKDNSKIKSTKFSKAMLAKISDEVVVVKSAVDNVTFISPKTKIEYNWLTKGDVEPLPVSEILAMESASKRFLHTPWLVVEDERVIDALGLKRTYDLIKKVEDVDELITLNKDDICKIFNELPNQYKNNFRNEIFKKVKTRELNNLSTIDDLSEILHIDLKSI
jgi:hypothetical protein